MPRFRSHGSLWVLHLPATGLTDYSELREKWFPASTASRAYSFMEAVPPKSFLASGDQPQPHSSVRWNPRALESPSQGLVDILVGISPRESPAQHCLLIHMIPLTSKSLQKSWVCTMHSQLTESLGNWPDSLIPTGSLLVRAPELSPAVEEGKEKSCCTALGKDKLCVIPLYCPSWRCLFFFFFSFLMDIFLKNIFLLIHAPQ